MLTLIITCIFSIFFVVFPYLAVGISIFMVGLTAGWRGGGLQVAGAHMRRHTRTPALLRYKLDQSVGELLLEAPVQRARNFF